LGKTKLSLHDGEQITLLKAGELLGSAFSYLKNVAGVLTVGAEAGSPILFASTLKFNNSLSIIASGGALSLGSSGDTVNLNVAGVTYNLSTITAATLTVTGNLTVSGAGTNNLWGTTVFKGDVIFDGVTATMNTVTFTVDDKNIELGSVATPTDITADGGGITLRGTTNKSIIWDDTNDNWTSSEHWNIAAGKFYKIGNTNLLGFTDPYTISYQNLKITNTSLTNTTRFVVEGNNGQLFAIVDDLSDSLLSVNDISGLPILEVFAADKVVMGKFGSNTLVVNSDKVGIGTAAPATKMHIRFSATESLYFDYDSGNYISEISSGRDGQFNTNYLRYDAYTHLFNYGASEWVRITNTGMVGIGTNNPQVPLHISGATASVWVIRSSGDPEVIVGEGTGANQFGGMIWNSSLNQLRVVTQANQSQLVLDNATGNIGINTTTPGTTLPGLFSGTTPKVLEIKSVSTSTDNGVFIRRSDDAVGLDLWSDNSAGYVYIDSRYNSSAGNIYFRTKTAGTAVNAFTILGSGNVGVGTAAPERAMEIIGNTAIRNADTANSSSRGIEITPGLVSDVNTIRSWNYGTGLLIDSANTGTADAGSEIQLYSAGSADIVFRATNYGTAQQERVRIKGDTGNVGIGTDSPNGKLEINRSTNFSYPTPGLTYGELHFNKVSSNTLSNAITFGGAGDPGAQAGIYVQASSGYGTKMYFGTTNSFATGSQVRMMIDHNGNVGIGTNNPGALLHVSGTSSGVIETRIYNTNTAGYSRLDLGNAQLVSFGSTYTTSGAYKQSGSIFYAGGAGGLQLASNSGTVNFYTGGVADANERMRILADGTIGIGTTSPGVPLGVVKSDTGTTLGSSGVVLNVANVHNTTNNIAAISFGNSGGGAGWSQIGVIYKDRTGGSEDQDLFFRVIAAGSSSEVMRISNALRVGIGTNDPLTKLHVYDSVAGGLLTIQGVTGGQGFGLSLLNSAGTAYIRLLNDNGNLRIQTNTADHIINVKAAGSIGFGTESQSTSNRLSVNGAVVIGSVYVSTAAPANGLLVEGNVGIGITPIATLDVNGTIVVRTSINGANNTANYLKSLNVAQNNHVKQYFQAGSYSWDIGTSPMMVMDSSGNVGIGIAGPSYKLDVAGDINISAGSSYRIAGEPLTNESVIKKITQNSHGLSVGNAIRINSSGVYVKAQADSVANAEVVGIVQEVVDVNTFKVVFAGMVTAGVPAQPPGTVLFLSDSSGGALSTTEPSAFGRVSKPVAVVTASASAMVVMNMRGMEIAEDDALGEYFDVTNLTGNHSASYLDNVFLCDASAGAFTVSLPTAADNQGKIFYIKKTDASFNDITIVPISGQYIDEEPSYILETKGEYVQIISNNLNWMVLSD
jgi:hypothetical protein